MRYIALTRPHTLPLIPQRPTHTIQPPPPPQGVYFISCGFGFALFGIASIFYRFTGSIFNPQISLALCMVGAIKPMRCLMVILSQFVAAIVAS